MPNTLVPLFRDKISQKSKSARWEWLRYVSNYRMPSLPPQTTLHQSVVACASLLFLALQTANAVCASRALRRDLPMCHNCLDLSPAFSSTSALFANHGDSQPLCHKSLLHSFPCNGGGAYAQSPITSHKFSPEPSCQPVLSKAKLPSSFKEKDECPFDARPIPS